MTARPPANRTRRWLPVLAVLGIALALGGIALTRSVRPTGLPFDPASPAPNGQLALVRTLRALDADVSIATRGPTEDADTAFIAQQDFDDRTVDAWDEWVRRGGTLVVSGRGRLAPEGVESSFFSFEDLEPGLRVTAQCDIAALADLPGLPITGSLRIDPDIARADGIVSCFPVGQGRALLAAKRHGDGHIVVLGSSFVFTNDGLRQPGHAELAAALLAPRAGTHVAIKGITPSDAFGNVDDTLLDLLPKPLKASAALLAAAMVLYTIARARRLGKPLVEPAPVEVPASELTVAAGNLLQRGRHRTHTAGMLRRGTASDLSSALGLARSATPEAVARTLAARGADEDQVLHALCGPAPRTDADLVALAQELDHLRDTVLGISRALALTSDLGPQ